MNNSIFNFRDDEEREMFIIAIPVIALFTWLGYWLMQSDAPEVTTQSMMVAIADTDGDGITDAHDQCPNTAGAIADYGCVKNVAWADKDNDTDGIRNEIDSCPETKGVAANKGCVAEVAATTAVAAAPVAIAEAEPVKPLKPVKPLDTDNDGFTDDIDACITVAGTGVDGCPADRDGDGVIDTQDQCPDEAGSADTNGCAPDTDNDGVIGAADKCPQQAGAAASDGCPLDTDGDGIDDLQDTCPTIAGNGDDGCILDTDGDGSPDNEDACPETAGTENGCPAVISVPDSDFDGIADDRDNCPNTAGVADNSGCPADNDGDGIANINDNCPDAPGDAILSGCPAQPVQVTEPVADNFAVQTVLDAAITGVKFNSSSSVLTARSRDILTTVSDLMRQYPDSILEIRGHTDSSGNAGKNLQLSLNRAQACATFLASQGIGAARLKAYGFGDTEPLVDNATPAGRETNRRVEFELKN